MVKKADKPVKAKKATKTKKFVIVTKEEGKVTSHVEVEATNIEDALTKALATGKLKNGALSGFTPSAFKKLSKK
jgi:uncharacterized membrane protein YkoI